MTNLAPPASPASRPRGSLGSRLLESVVGALDTVFSRVQRFTGVTGMAYIFVAPNMLVFSIFVLFPMLFNFVYTFTGSDKLFLNQRPYVGAANLERLFDCGDFLRPATCNEDLFASAVLNTARLRRFASGGDDRRVAVDGGCAERADTGARLFPQRCSFIRCCCRRFVVAMILALDAAGKWLVQRLHCRAGRRENALFDRPQLGALLGGDGQRLVADGLLHADSAGGLAGDSSGFVRGGGD